MLSKFLKINLVLAVAVFPILASAQLGQTEGILNQVKNIVTDVLIPLAFTLALLFFFYGIAKYIWSVGQEKEEGKKIMIWGVIALFVMSSVWGLVSFIQGELNLSNNTSGKIPTIQ
jgi:hypothetical protein